MSLTLTITSYHRLSTHQEITKTVEQGDLTIGRAPENDWVLPDPQQVLSKRHCLIQYRDDKYYIKDTSTNGVFINQSPSPLGRGQTVHLNDSDEITLGDYEILVHISLPHEQSQPEIPDQPTERISTLLLKEDPPEEWVKPEKSSDEALPSYSLPADSGVHITPESNALSASPEDDKQEAIVPADSKPDDVLAESVSFQTRETDEERPVPLAGEESTPAEISEQEEPNSGLPTEFFSGVPESLPSSPEPPSKVATPQPSFAKEQFQQAMEAFLSGAGLAKLPIADAELTEIMMTIGKIFRETTKGLMEVFISRSQIRSEFRLLQTTLKRAENNPLKFSLSVDDAMINLLTKRGPDYLPAERALQEAFDDIKSHQLAVMAGMQAALFEFLKRFDPRVLEARSGDSRLLEKIVPSRREARYWRAFTALYAELPKTMQPNDFQELFGKEFARAYEAMIRKN